MVTGEQTEVPFDFLKGISLSLAPMLSSFGNRNALHRIHPIDQALPSSEREYCRKRDLDPLIRVMGSPISVLTFEV
jgi:hypothetical protein